IHRRLSPWQLRRTRVATLAVQVVFVLSFGICTDYALSDAVSDYPRCLVCVPPLAPYTQSQNATQNVRTISHARSPSYPLKSSPDTRHLVAQNNEPFLMVGDAPQTLIANLSQAEAARYMANRQKYGINTLWVNLLCNYSDGCNSEAKTFDGLPPFDVVGD